MPEYLAPGVYVEEVSFRSKSIEGVSTTTTGFIGPARFGPIDLEPDVITSLGEFERIYGDRQQLDYGGQKYHNYLWHAVRAFFEEGGRRLYVARVFHTLDDGSYPPSSFAAASATMIGEDYVDGHARAQLPKSEGSGQALELRARFPGKAGNMRVRFTLQLGQNVLDGVPDPDDLNIPPALLPIISSLQDRDVVWISDITSPIESPPGSGKLYVAESFFDTATQKKTWRFRAPDGGELSLSDLTPALDPDEGDQVRVATLTVTVIPDDPEGLTQVWNGLSPDPLHQQAGARDGLTERFAQKPSNLAQARTLPIVIEAVDSVDDGAEVIEALFAEKPSLRAALNNPNASIADLSVEVELKGGNDGKRPEAPEYEGEADLSSTTRTGLKAFEDIEDISIVAAPGSTFGLENGYRSHAMTIINLLISHAQRMRYRIAVLDSGDEQSIAQVRAMRAKLDSTYAAIYYPWVRVLDPVTRKEIHLPPSGFVAGIYARNDINRAVYKAPANEVVNLAIGFEQLLNKGQQDVLNPEGVNCFRFFEGRGFRLWGARTISSDPEWKYVNLRRYFAYLERSIDRGTQWAVFEPNGEALWANVRRTVEDFMLNEWMSGALLGDRPEKAFFVKCDRSTMTQNDLDNGRLICLIGVAALRPAEFVIFRIGQWTADRRI
jgi:phage tail sheath protein FI